MIPPALRHRRYRLLWIGLLISIAGTRMQAAAILWHINQVSGQPLALGGVGLANIVPVLFFSLLAGVAADAINRRRLLLVTQTALAVLAGLLGWLTMRGAVSLWSIYLITALSAGVATFDMPARQALVPNLLPREHLTNAFSLNSIAFQFGSIAGPALGGLVLAHWDIAYAYWLNAFSYLAVILALVLMGPVDQEIRADESEGRTLSEVLPSVAEGLRFVVHQPIIFSTMLLDFFATFFSSATALLPIFAKDILGVGALGYGWLVAAPSVGAGGVAAVLTFSGAIRRQGRVLLLAIAGFGVATVIFGLSRSFWLTFIALAMVGATDGVSTIIRNTVRQLQTPDRLRGRMTSVNQMFFMGGPQLGELEAGLVAQWLGAPLSVISGGIGCLLAVAWTAARYPQIRHYNGDEPLLAGEAAAATRTGYAKP
jgi:MFS family permease